ncbi:tetratricopeptide repeat protein [Bacillus andreraoultii]|uniref:tetratricopeptide repeat protein n=1 Tax=Bacillus andreraoultii TaxID=1499685 RepID=UPI0005397D5D|nr:tetratricopeptide repeat protein [Bacillus andreraoultii]
MKEYTSNGKIIPLPNLPLRLLQKSQNLLVQGEIKEAIKFLQEAEQLDPENPDILYTLVGAYMEIGNLSKVRTLLEEMIYSGLGEYFQTVELYISVLFQLHEYKKINTMLTMLLEDKQVPFHKLEQYEELLELSEKLANENSEMSSEQVEMLFEGDTNTVISRIANLDAEAIANCLNEIKDYLLLEDGNPLIKTILLNALKENEINEEVEVEKFDQYIRININEYVGVQEAPFPNKVKQKLEEILLSENPSLLSYAQTLCDRFFFAIDPLTMKFTDLNLWGYAILSVVEDYLGEDFMESYAIDLLTVHLNEEEIDRAKQFILKVEQEINAT